MSKMVNSLKYEFLTVGAINDMPLNLNNGFLLIKKVVDFFIHWSYALIILILV